MGFRRDGQAARSWFLWLDRHRDALVECGLPTFLYTDECQASAAVRGA